MERLTRRCRFGRRETKYNFQVRRFNVGVRKICVRRRLARGRYGESRALSAIHDRRLEASQTRSSHRIASHRHLLYHPQTTALHSRQRHTHFSTEQHLWTQTRNHGHNSRNAYHIHRNTTYCWSTTRRQPPHHLLPRTRTPQNTRHPSRIRHASMRRSSHHLRSPPFKCRLDLDHKHNLGQGTPCIG